MNKVMQVRLRFLLGEWLIATWCPHMVYLSHRCSSEVDLPKLNEIIDALPEPPADGYLFRQASPRLFAAGVGRLKRWITYVPRIEKLYYVEIVGGFEAYLGRRSAKSRYNLRRAIQRLQHGGSESILEVLTDPKDKPRFHGIASSISIRTYQSKLLGAGFPASSEYLSSMVALAETGCARAYLLKEKGEPIAFAWCTSHERSLTYQIIGYLPDYASLSPGTVLLTMILEDVFLSGQYDRFDFGVGEAPYKSSFATHVLEFADIYFFRFSFRNLFLVRVHWTTEHLSSSVGRLLDRFGVKNKVKHLIRSIRGAGST